MDRLLEKATNGLRRRCLVLDCDGDLALTEFAKKHHISRSAAVRTLIGMLLPVTDISGRLLEYKALHNMQEADGT